MRILIDMDGVLADFLTGFKQAWVDRGLPPYFDTPLEQWDLKHYVPLRHRGLVDVLMHQQVFFRGLPVMPGAVDAVLALMQAGHSLWICSTPVAMSAYCEGEKKAWLRAHFGETFARRMLFTHDKTLVKGHILIDDKPVIEGECTPEWEHVLFTHSYNSTVTGRRRLTWMNWREVLPELVQGDHGP
jgi:5'-nucleotidase